MSDPLSSKAGPRSIGAAFAALAERLGVIIGRGVPATATAGPEGVGAEAAFTPFFPAMLDLLPDPLILIQGWERQDAGARRFIYANNAARDLLRIQRPQAALTTAIRAPEVLDAVDVALFDDTPSQADYVIRGVQDRFWRASALPLPQPLGAPRLALLTLRDETEIRRSERTRADFLANASHELRTPLASLTGFIETLRGHAREDPEARERFLGIMHIQAERMRGLIDDLMSLSRIELSEHIPPSGQADMVSVVIDVLDALGPLAKTRSVTFQTRLPSPGEAVAAADRGQIVQVIQNLVENAIKYTADGGSVMVEVIGDLATADAGTAVGDLPARFSILTPDRATGKRYVVVRVRDFGPGIDRNHLPRLTERFYRVEGQKVRDRPGTGLGLAIVKHILNRHRGGLIVESGLGVGTRFTAYVPKGEAAGA